jgi:LPXTG-site transpeptidase (sortase) family protein
MVASVVVLGSMMAGCTIHLGAQHSAAPPASPSASFTPTPTPSIERTATQDPEVPSVPTALLIPAAGINTFAPISEYTNAQLGPDNTVDPPTLFAISWWSGGGRPGTDEINTPRTQATALSDIYTTFLYGHSWTDPAIFNEIKSLVAGDIITLQTSSGTFTYVVQELVVVPKGDFQSNSLIDYDLAGKLVIATCYRPVNYNPNKETVNNVAVIAQQVS